MAVSSIKDFWIHPNALTITLNYFGDPQLIQTSMLAGAVIMAYRKDVITYDAAHNFREWKLQAFPTQLNDTCAYYVHAELSRSGDTAMIIYSPVKRDIQGRMLLRVEKDEDGRDVEVWDNNLSTESYFIYLGTISASVDNEGATVERAWTDGFYTGTLDTDQQRMEEASGEWKTMFNYNAVTDQIEPLKPFSKIKVMGEAIFQSIAQFVNGLVIGKRKITDVAASSDSGNVSKVSDATLPTTGYVQKEIEALDDHFLIKDNADTEQFVAGTVTFEKDVIVQGDHAVEGVQTIGKEDAAGNFDVNKVVQEVKGKQILDGGFQTPNFNNAAGQITGAHLTPDGKLYVSGLKANNFEIDELVFNVVKAQGGEFVYSTSAIISSCSYVMKVGSTRLKPDEFYASPTHDWADIDHVEITLKKDELTRSGNPFVVGDIIYGKVNKVSESGKHAVGGQCIMHITEIVDGLNITAKLYQVGEYGLTDNIPPIEDMTIAHRGNDITHDGNGNEINKDRRTSFYLSTIDGNLVMLNNVTTPTLSAANYGASLGKLPADLLLEVQKVFAQINENSSVVYADYGIFKNFIQFDLQDQPIQRENNRGEWSFNYADDIGYKNTPSYYDVVTYNGQLYKCLKSGVMLAPDRSLDWLLLVAKGQDGDMPTIYTIASSLTAIHQDSNGGLNTNVLDIWVNAVGAPANFEIKDQASLDNRGLSVWYNTDYEEDVRHKLTIGSSDVIEVEGGGAIIVAEDDDEGGAFISLEGESIDISDIESKINIYLVSNADEDGFGTDEDRMYIPVVRDGSKGKAGPVGYPQGEWKSDVTYTKTDLTAPFVWYRNDNRYYLLKADKAEGNSQSPSNEDYWEPFTQFEYLFVKMLMANWAMFGSDNGAVFYDRYLFSQQGIDSEGNMASFGSYIDNMFDSNGDLAGTFIPNASLDFLRGGMTVSRFSEPFIRKEGNVIRLNTDEPHNIRISTLVDSTNNVMTSTNYSFQNKLVLLPEYDEEKYIEDGRHFSILMEHMGAAYGRCFGDTNNAWKNHFALVGVDSMLASDSFDSDGYSTGHYFGNWFIWNGLRSKFVIMTPGTILKLRLYRHKEGTDMVNYWYVENTSEFTPSPVDFYVYTGEVSTNADINAPFGTYCKMTGHPNDSYPIYNLSADESYFKPMILGSAKVFGNTYMGSGYFGFVLSTDRAKNGLLCARAVRGGDVFN